MSEAVRQMPPTSAITRWSPPMLWMGAIFFFSTDYFSAGNTAGMLARVLRFLWPAMSGEQFETIHFLVRKFGHFSVYAVLALLVIRALASGSSIRWRRQWALYALLIVGIYALLDEYHQSFSSQRTASVYDSLIDFCGGTFMVVVCWLRSLRR